MQCPYDCPGTLVANDDGTWERHDPFTQYACDTCGQYAVSKTGRVFALDDPADPDGDPVLRVPA